MFQHMGVEIFDLAIPLRLRRCLLSFAPAWALVSVLDDTGLWRRGLEAEALDSGFQHLRDVGHEDELHLVAQLFGQVFHQVQLVLFGQDHRANA